MEFIPIQTRRLEPPKDDLLGVLDEVLTDLREKDVVVIASKAVAIDEGRCLTSWDEETKERLIAEESDHVIASEVPGGWDLCIKNRMVSFAAGIDESNAGGCLLLLPEDPHGSAAHIRARLAHKHGLQDLGVLITDSSALPFRQGVIALSIGHAGIFPVDDKTSKTDLFGRPFYHTYVDVVDGLAVAAGFAMGETDESTPVCIVRNAPHVRFTNEDRSGDLRIAPEDDVFYPLMKGMYET